MFDQTLLGKSIRLAYENPKYRERLLGILTTQKRASNIEEYLISKILKRAKIDPNNPEAVRKLRARIKKLLALGDPDRNSDPDYPNHKIQSHEARSSFNHALRLIDENGLDRREFTDYEKISKKLRSLDITHQKAFRTARALINRYFLGSQSLRGKFVHLDSWVQSARGLAHKKVLSHEIMIMEYLLNDARKRNPVFQNMPDMHFFKIQTKWASFRLFKPYHYTNHDLEKVVKKARGLQISETLQTMMWSLTRATHILHGAVNGDPQAQKVIDSLNYINNGIWKLDILVDGFFKELTKLVHTPEHNQIPYKRPALR